MPGGGLNEDDDYISPEEMFDGIQSGEVLLGEFLAWLEEQKAGHEPTLPGLPPS